MSDALEDWIVTILFFAGCLGMLLLFAINSKNSDRGPW